ncbi:hypothetical protein OSH10_04855 [Kaistia defluvii]|uniref:hypothetical protein n=1 Tax=Kaistia defluvii TaxID=410841 RepID=UPI002257F279|nr:hypothetical protein [Kaistia defluvii]MCX5517756.1 hypothetical protein [Kaistia defluvii]
MEKNARLAEISRQLFILVKEAEALEEYQLAAQLIEALHEAKRCGLPPHAHQEPRADREPEK